MCDLLLVINSNLHPILHRFQDIPDYWSIALLAGVPVYNVLVRGKVRATKFDSQTTRRILLSYVLLY